MASDFLAVRNDLRELERRVLYLHAKLGEQGDWRPLQGIANSIGNFAEMLPIYKSFVEFLETAHGITPDAGWVARP